ncbi:aspartate carbamoyltransferase regulatory subunit [Vibrio vulnificus]|jgi:aspartate carbamoyltransferase regulatory subunit|uniref:Aspartate carbamoyltransferase regulatory chain n=2 Tax=Vibrio vulnificus TaxID=672 RepID=PYRI_VIBVU|nr:MULTISPECIES: aspartate carbamoyltransferase regulatory subunit [Vibrio]Q8DCF7.1 RecName: Full=Aspartate carbamoyltransferase regulatory chain [Vibrio vulnificus CMCP6]EWS69200.1 aspartate carbamoyltransferase regulatory subunit [Vibrio vulnificus BAA87]OJI54469.1 Aspartate carbamoyltransferase regulatory chain [Vibrio fluvialis]AAO09903.1 aspartate carbamoyltransferase, regulatory subunit [Vibrio vulnificus CMCP6]AMG13199.1 aspartate carbamoyltransferase regulatory subunit [Vibrio vulnific
MNKETKLQVEAIKNGTVIDHIPAQVGIKVLKLFDMHNSSQRVTIGLNLPSSALGNKDLLKIENVFINEEQASKLALYAPHATVNQIEDYQVVKKLALELPEFVSDVFECPNTNCITHNEPVASNFRVFEKKGDVRLKCKYCEKVFSREIVTER